MVYIGFILIVIGLGFIASGIVGLIRFRDFYTKIHASGVTECCGIPFCLVGLSFLQSDFSAAFKLIIIALIILLLNPVSTYALARASVLYKIDKDGRIK
jgi:multicomponent Na+:H+ antiporter subunit G